MFLKNLIKFPCLLVGVLILCSLASSSKSLEKHVSRYWRSVGFVHSLHLLTVPTPKQCLSTIMCIQTHNPWTSHVNSKGCIAPELHPPQFSPESKQITKEGNVDTLWKQILNKHFQLAFNVYGWKKLSLYHEKQHVLSIRKWVSFTFSQN